MALPFGDVPIGTSRAVTIQFLNAELAAVTVKSIALATATPDLVLSDVLTFDCQNNLRPAESAMTLAGGNCATITVRYAPQASGELNDSIIILSNAPYNPSITIPVTGSGAPVGVLACFLTGTGVATTVDTGTCAPVTVPPAVLDFGTMPVGSATTRGLRVFNEGMNGLEITSAQILDSNVDFSLIAASGPAAISPQSSVDLTVQFIPQSVGIATTSLIIRSTDPVHPTLSLPLTGTGVQPSVCLSPRPTLDFGRVTEGTSQQLSLILTNCGGVDNTITALHLIDTGTPGPFTMAPMAPGALPALPLPFPTGANVTLDFIYAPVAVTAAGSRDIASFVISTDLQNEIIQLVGEGGARDR